MDRQRDGQTDGQTRDRLRLSSQSVASMEKDVGVSMRLPMFLNVHVSMRRSIVHLQVQCLPKNSQESVVGQEPQNG